MGEFTLTDEVYPPCRKKNCEEHCEVCGAHEGQMHLAEECFK